MSWERSLSRSTYASMPSLLRKAETAAKARMPNTTSTETISMSVKPLRKDGCMAYVIVGA